MINGYEIDFKEDNDFKELELHDIEKNEPITEEDLRLIELEKLLF